MKPIKSKLDIAITSQNEKYFFDDVLQILNEGHKKIRAAVNSAMVETYWNIGRGIVKQEQQGNERTNYGEQLLVNMSWYLGNTLGKGFSVANLWNFRQFYLASSDETIVRYSVLSENRQISASKYKLILSTEEELMAELELSGGYMRERWGVTDE